MKIEVVFPISNHYAQSKGEMPYCRTSSLFESMPGLSGIMHSHCFFSGGTFMMFRVCWLGSPWKNGRKWLLLLLESRGTMDGTGAKGRNARRVARMMIPQKERDRIAAEKGIAYNILWKSESELIETVGRWCGGSEQSIRLCVAQKSKHMVD